MRYLLDTQILIWLSFRSERLPEVAREIASNDSDDSFFSAASLWEVSIKAALERPDFDVDPVILRDGLLESGYIELFVSGEHAVAVRTLAQRHGDPFDRLLLAQAIHEGMTLVTTDRVLAGYGAPVLKV